MRRILVGNRNSMFEFYHKKILLLGASVFLKIGTLRGPLKLTQSINFTPLLLVGFGLGLGLILSGF